jgi:hypothetical protein
MRRKLKNLKHKSGHSENGAPRQLIDEMVYREHGASINHFGKHYDSEYSGWSWATRPQDQAISIRKSFPRGTGVSAPSGPT